MIYNLIVLSFPISKFINFVSIKCFSPASYASTLQPLIDVKFGDLCYMVDDGTPELWIFFMIALEVILIMMIVGKVWYDQRTFRKTGVLPWFSAKMPRLPCDAMLEGVKDHHHTNNNNNSASTNSLKNFLLLMRNPLPYKFSLLVQLVCACVYSY